MTRLMLAVDREWLTPGTWGDLEWSTCWPGGSDSLTFEATNWNRRLFRADADVRLMWGAQCLWAGTMLDPTPGLPIVCEGLWRAAKRYTALDALGEASLEPSASTDAAIARGMPWEALPLYTTASEPWLTLDPPSGTTVALNPDQPHTIADLIGASALERGGEWGVDPTTRRVTITAWPTAPIYHARPGLRGLGISRDGYASTIHARYLDSTSGTMKTVTSTDATAEARWGHVETTHPEALGEGISMTAARAQSLVDGLVAQGRPQIGWTTPIEAQYGDVVNEHGQAVDLEKITAGQVIRIHGLIDDMGDLSGRTWVDVPLARVVHPRGGNVAVLEPRKLVNPAKDALTGKAAS